MHKAFQVHMLNDEGKRKASPRASGWGLEAHRP